MSIVIQILEILGSLGVFFYGMKTMSEAIQRLAGERLRMSLNYITRNRVKGVFTGFFITALIQSSSATTVMLVSFVNAGLLTLTESIGVIMGANLGTTVTIWIISLLGFKVSLSAISIPIIGIGIPFTFSKKSVRTNSGEAIVGFGLLFLGLGLLKKAVPDIKNNPEVLSFLAEYTNMGFASILLFIFFGVVLTVVVQSSSAAAAVTVTMAFQGWIDFPIAAAIVLGENIGTTITAYLAAMNANTKAKQAARAHFVFNMIGVIWMLLVFYPFIHFIGYLVPGDYTVAENIPLHLSAFHTLFNLLNILLLIAFVKQIAAFVEKLIKSPEEEEEQNETEYRLDYISTGVVKTPEMYLYKARSEIIKMAIISHNMFQVFLNVFFHPDQEMGSSVKDVKKQEELIDNMKNALTRFLSKLTREELTETSSYKVTAMMRIVNEIESVADCCFQLILSAQKRFNNKMDLHPTAHEEIKEFSNDVLEFMHFNIENLADARLSSEDLHHAVQLEEQIDASREALRESSVKRIGELGHVKAEMLFMDIIKNFERIGDYSLNISQALRRIVAKK